MNDIMLHTILILIAITAIFAMPFALIWALNTIFPVLAIPYGVETWLAAFIIPAAFKTELSFKKKD